MKFLERLKKVWNEEYKDIIVPVGLINNTNEKWKEIRKKIIEKTFSFDDYVKKDADDAEYLPNFIENRTSVTGGVSYGSQRYVMLKRNHDKKGVVQSDYFLRKWEADNVVTQPFPEDVLKANKTQASEYFDNYVKPFLEALIEINTLADADSFLNESKFVSSAFIKKIVLLNSLTPEDSLDYGYKYQLPFMSKKENVDKLYEQMFGSIDSNIGFFEKCAAVYKKAVDELSITSDETNRLANLYRISKLLWDFSAVLCDSSEKTLNTIYYGCPGTGKTYEVKKIIRFLDEEQYCLVQFHPGYSYEDFIEGVKPTGIDEHGNIKFSVVNGQFKNLCIKAKDNPDKPYYFIADEINRANLSSVFGECLSLLEKDYRYKKDDLQASKNLRETPLSALISHLIEENESNKSLAFDYNEKTKKVTFGIPFNIYFIGTMNDVDRSIDTFDLALRRRFIWVRKDFSKEVLQEQLSLQDGLAQSEIDKYVNDCEKLNSYISSDLGLGKGFEFGHSYFFSDIDNFLIKKDRSEEKFIDRKKIFNQRLLPLLEQYLLELFSNEKELKDKINLAKEKFGILDE